MPITEGCGCGMIRYVITCDALPPSYACHCRDCQTWSGSAFALHAMVPESLLTLDPGAHRFRTTDRGGCNVTKNSVVLLGT